jgi:catechol 2,3-dioxygenase
MFTEALDFNDLLALPDQPDDHLPEGTTIGHVHLHVADLSAAEHFYAGIAGFGVKQRLAGSALFVAAGDYHHHVGLNTWAGVGAFNCFIPAS